MEIENLIKELSSKISDSANVKAIFSQPIEIDDITIINVAKVSYSGGWGMGGGQDDDNGSGSGGGMGGMVQTTPIGYIQVIDGDAAFKPIIDINNMIKKCFIFGTVIFIASRLLKKRY